RRPARRRSRRARDGAPRRPSPRARRARAAGPRGERALRLSARLPRPLLREAALPLRPPRARRTSHLLRARRGRRRSREGAGASLPRLRGGGSVSLMRLAAAFRRAKPGFVDGCRRWPQDAALAARRRTLVLSPPRSLASIGSGNPGA